MKSCLNEQVELAGTFMPDFSIQFTEIANRIKILLQVSLFVSITFELNGNSCYISFLNCLYEKSV
jgi:hypothetical protein